MRQAAVKSLSTNRPDFWCRLKIRRRWRAPFCALRPRHRYENVSRRLRDSSSSQTIGKNHRQGGCRALREVVAGPVRRQPIGRPERSIASSNGLQRTGRVLLVTQHYAPFPSTTSGYMTDIAKELALESEMIVLSGTPSSGSKSPHKPGEPTVIEIRSWWPGKSALGLAIACRGIVRRPGLSFRIEAQPPRGRRSLRHDSIHIALCRGAGGATAQGFRGAYYL